MSAGAENAGNEVGWMRCNRFVLMVLLALGLAAAFSVRPEYRGVQDTGSGSISMDVGIMIDCDTNSLAVTVKSNDTGEPIPDASTYLFYTNYGYQALSSGKTNDAGVAAIPVTGKRDYLTSLFVLRVDKQGFRSREIEFTFKKCFEAPPQGNGETPGHGNQTTPPSQNITLNVSVNQTLPANQTGNVTANATVPKPLPQNTSVGNATNQTSSTGKPSAPCLPGFLLIPFVLYQAIPRKSK
jgi:hypothetical protein